MENRIEQACIIVLDKWANIIRTRVETEHGKINTIQGETHSEQDAVRVIGNMISVRLKFSGMKSWILEYGSGSKLDRDNPYLQQYIDSSNFNKERIPEGYEFIGRAEGETVVSPDGSSYQSSGQAHRRVHHMNNASYRVDGQKGQYGLHLERPLNKSGNNPGYEAQEPMHIINNQIDMALPEIYGDIMDAVGEVIVEQMQELFVTKKIII